MSRSGYGDYSDSEYPVEFWRQAVTNASEGKRGQKFFRDLLAALDAMPEKFLIADELENEGEVCAIGSLGRIRGVDMSKLDVECPDEVAKTFGVATCLVQEIMYMNDEHALHDETPGQRWVRMRAWVSRQIKDSELVSH